MKQFSEITPVMRYSWSRSHCGGHNYLTIEQTIYMTLNGTASVVKKGKIVDKELKSYDLAAINEMRTEDDLTSEKHMIFESMSPTNTATKHYKHFRIIFANGRELIVSNYKEFLEIVTGS